MQEYEKSILEKYKIGTCSTRKVRGAVLCDTAQGIFLLREAAAPISRILALCELQKHLTEQGYSGVDCVIPNEEGDYITVGEDGRKYMLRQWFFARECAPGKAAEILAAAGNLAKLHMLMQVEIPTVPAAEHLGEEYDRHNRELRKVRKFVRAMTSKGEFEVAFLGCFDEMYEWTRAAGDYLGGSGYEKLRKESLEKNCLVHGEYNYHNILMKCGEGYRAAVVAATTNFDRFRRNIQAEDLYYFLRKVMEKHGWKERLGDNMLNAYSAIRPLSAEEIKYLKLRLLYPEKFWKIANSYYHSNKAWVSVKNTEKLNIAIRQTKEKEKFIGNIFR